MSNEQEYLDWCDRYNLNGKASYEAFEAATSIAMAQACAAPAERQEAVAHPCHGGCQMNTTGDPQNDCGECAMAPPAASEDIFDLIREWAHLPEGQRGDAARAIIGSINKSYAAGVADGKALGQAAAMPGKVAEPMAWYRTVNGQMAGVSVNRLNPDLPGWAEFPLYAAPPHPAPQQAPAVQGQDGEQQRREKENTAFFKWWKESGHADDPTFNLTAENCAHATWQACAAQKVTASESDADEDAYVIENMGKLLAGVAVALKGPEPARKRWSYHDLPEIAAKIMLELELHRAKEAATPSPAVPPSDAPDKARMNFLVQHIVDVRKELLHGSRLMFTSQAEYDDNEEFLGTTLREQIDAAIAASQQDGRDKSNG